MHKKAVITSPADWMKGLLIGLIIAFILAFLIFKGIIPIPFISNLLS